jgi:quercetin dioxygenase-like cupin family protein
MSHKLFWICVSVSMLFVVSTSFAQDPTKVEASHYKIAFENASVQVVNVYYGPHEKSGMHDHPGGVVVVITAGHLRFTDEHGKVQEVFSKAGESRWFPPFRHTVENLGETPYNAVYIGIKNKQTANADLDPLHPQIDVQTAKLIGEYLSASQTHR